MAQISRKYTFTAGTNISSSQMNEELNQLVNEENAKDTRLQTLENNTTVKTVIKKGRTGTISVSVGQDLTTTVTFATAFASAPNVVVTPNAGYRSMDRVFYQISDVTATNFKIRTHNTHPNTDMYLFYDWIAIL